MPDPLMTHWQELRIPLQHEFALLGLDELDARAGDRESLMDLLEAHYPVGRAHLQWEIDELIGRTLGGVAMQQTPTSYAQNRDQWMNCGELD